MKSGLAILFAASLGIQPLPQPDGPLEPSVQNEVDHAVARGERWLAAAAGRPSCRGTNVAAVACVGDLFSTNGLTRERIAVKLISSQRAGGWWLMETNTAPTRLAIEILKGL
ncbi:MAG: hypothetical protein J6V72_19445 [Kiritimatiellae bacterium]|nr:hypothetical protein [Kiritimatiellia bacterium]